MKEMLDNLFREFVINEFVEFMDNDEEIELLVDRLENDFEALKDEMREDFMCFINDNY